MKALLPLIFLSALLAAGCSTECEATMMVVDKNNAPVSDAVLTFSYRPDALQKSESRAFVGYIPIQFFDITGQLIYYGIFKPSDVFESDDRGIIHFRRPDEHPKTISVTSENLRTTLIIQQPIPEKITM